MAVAPIWSGGSAGNVIAAATSVAASASTTSSSFGAYADYAMLFQVSVKGVTALAGTNGCQVDFYRYVGSTPVVDTSPFYTIQLAVTSTSVANIYSLGPFDGGPVAIKATNLDGTNSILVGITGDVMTGIG